MAHMFILCRSKPSLARIYHFSIIAVQMFQTCLIFQKVHIFFYQIHIHTYVGDCIVLFGVGAVKKKKESPICGVWDSG